MVAIRFADEYFTPRFSVQLFVFPVEHLLGRNPSVQCFVPKKLPYEACMTKREGVVLAAPSRTIQNSVVEIRHQPSRVHLRKHVVTREKYSHSRAVTRRLRQFPRLKMSRFKIRSFCRGSICRVVSENGHDVPLVDQLKSSNVRCRIRSIEAAIIFSYTQLYVYFRHHGAS